MKKRSASPHSGYWTLVFSEKMLRTQISQRQYEVYTNVTYFRITIMSRLPL